MSRLEATSGTLRLFVAIELPEMWHEALAQVQRRLAELIERAETPRLRWVRPEGMHLTLKFLGQVARDRLADIEQALGQAVTSSPGIKLRLAHVGQFSGSGRVLRVLWAGVEGDTEALIRLARDIDASCEGIGFEREQRPFAPHLTLARAGDRTLITVDQTLAQQLRELEMPPVPELTVQSISLMRSHLERGGARYERIASWPAGSGS